MSKSAREKCKERRDQDKNEIHKAYKREMQKKYDTAKRERKLREKLGQHNEETFVDKRLEAIILNRIQEPWEDAMNDARYDRNKMVREFNQQNPKVKWRYEATCNLTAPIIGSGHHDNQMCAYVLWVQRPNRKITPQVSIRKTKIKELQNESANYGLFAEKRFNPGDIVTQYMGVSIEQGKAEFYKTHKDKSVDYEKNTQYRFGDIDAVCGFEENKPLYMGGQFINEARGVDINNRFIKPNVVGFDDGKIFAMKTIHAGQEIYMRYDWSPNADSDYDEKMKV